MMSLSGRVGHCQSSHQSSQDFVVSYIAFMAGVEPGDFDGGSSM